MSTIWLVGLFQALIFVVGGGGGAAGRRKGGGASVCPVSLDPGATGGGVVTRSPLEKKSLTTMVPLPSPEPSPGVSRGQQVPPPTVAR